LFYQETDIVDLLLSLLLTLLI